MNFNANNTKIADKKKSSKGKDKCEDLVAKSGELKKILKRYGLNDWKK